MMLTQTCAWISSSSSSGLNGVVSLSWIILKFLIVYHGNNKFHFSGKYLNSPSDEWQIKPEIWIIIKVVSACQWLNKQRALLDMNLFCIVMFFLVVVGEVVTAMESVLLLLLRPSDAFTLCCPSTWSSLRSLRRFALWCERLDKVPVSCFISVCVCAWFVAHEYSRGGVASGSVSQKAKILQMITCVFIIAVQTSWHISLLTSSHSLCVHCRLLLLTSTVLSCLHRVHWSCQGGASWEPT